jgi:hypothetical protein
MVAPTDQESLQGGKIINQLSIFLIIDFFVGTYRLSSHASHKRKNALVTKERITSES